MSRRTHGDARRGERGFTLIELSVAVAVIGVLATVVAPEFLEYMRRARSSEARLMMSAFTRKLKIYYATNLELPQDSSGWLPVPGFVGACPNKHPVSTDWGADPVFGPLGFSVDEPARENFVYIGLGSTAWLWSFYDYDCDGHVTGELTTYEIVNGNIQVTETRQILGPD